MLRRSLGMAPPGPFPEIRITANQKAVPGIWRCGGKSAQRRITVKTKNTGLMEVKMDDRGCRRVHAGSVRADSIMTRSPGSLRRRSPD